MNIWIPFFLLTAILICFYTLIELVEDKFIRIIRLLEKRPDEEKTTRINTGIITLVLFLLTFIWWNVLFSSEIVSYPTTKDNNNTLPLNRTIYKVNESEQTVIYWMPGFSNPPSKLANCVVRDKKNWIGHYPDGSGSVYMSKGKIVPDENIDLKYVNKYYWWLLNLGILK